MKFEQESTFAFFGHDKRNDFEQWTVFADLMID
jgi:hypothetical protein